MSKPKRVPNRGDEIGATFILLLFLGPFILIAWVARKVADRL